MAQFPHALARLLAQIHELEAVAETVAVADDRAGLQRRLGVTEEHQFGFDPGALFEFASEGGAETQFAYHGAAPVDRENSSVPLGGNDGANIDCVTETPPQLAPVLALGGARRGTIRFVFHVF